MTNYFSKEEVASSGLPYFNGFEWVGISNTARKILLTKNRCKMLNKPLQKHEDIAAFRYVLHGKSGKNYVPLFDRTNDRIPRNRLYIKEIIPYYPAKSRRKLQRLSMYDLAGKKGPLRIITFDGTAITKIGLSFFNEYTQTETKISHFYYRIRIVLDSKGTILAKRKHLNQELYLQ